MEFLFGMFVGGVSVGLTWIAIYTTKDKKLDGKDYNNVGGITLQDMVDSEYDPENYFKPEGTV